jgi:hypothetical protein
LFDGYPSLITAAFDYKIVHWHLEDLKSKQTCSKSLFDLLSTNLGKEALQYNPPFVYCLGAYTTRAGSRQLVTGLGNGMLLRFKKKGLELQEICGETGHGDQISALIVDQARGMLISGSHDKTIAIHRMAEDGE